MSREHDLHALKERYSLSEPARRKLDALVDLLAGDPAAATAVRERQRVLDDHVADSLVALELPVVRAARSIADLGSGAGVPGLPLAIALPAAHVTLLESNGRKCEFIERAIARCELENAEVVNARAESWEDGRGRNELVTARALAPLAVVAEYAAPLLRDGGSLVAWRGKRNPEEEAMASRAAAQLGLEPTARLRVSPYPEARHRHLHVMRKVAPTPGRFPRRPGVARKRPLS